MRYPPVSVPPFHVTPYHSILHPKGPRNHTIFPLLPILPQRHRFPQFAAVAAPRSRRHHRHRTPEQHCPLGDTPQRHRFPQFAHVHAGTTVTDPLNSIVPSETHHNGTVSRNSLPLRHHVLHCIQPSQNRHSHLLQSLLSTHLHNLLIIHNLSREPFYRLISYIAYNSLHTAYFSTYTSLHLTPSEGVQFPRVFRPPSEGA